MSEELKPCPFCGKKPVGFPVGPKDEGLMIECITPGCVHPHVSYIPPQSAIAAWNTRSDGWLAISEAKKESRTEIWGWNGISQDRWHWNSSLKTPCWRRWFRSAMEDMQNQPTHYMPLPTPPAEQSDADNDKV